jgi:adenine-specific DNA-methyltransferase
MFNGILKPNSKFDLKYLLALLNSTLFSYWQMETSPKANRKLFPTLLMETVENFPLPEIDRDKQKQYVDLVNCIISSKKMGCKSDDIEAQIDQLVYKLFELTAPEIEIIENGVK